MPPVSPNLFICSTWNDLTVLPYLLGLGLYLFHVKYKLIGYQLLFLLYITFRVVLKIRCVSIILCMNSITGQYREHYKILIIKRDFQLESLESHDIEASFLFSPISELSQSLWWLLYKKVRSVNESTDRSHITASTISTKQP